MNASLTPREILALKREILSSLHCALPGVVEAYDPETGTADIRPAGAYPLLSGVPVFMPLPFEVSPGDACLLVFADLDTEAWLSGGDAPASGRRHSLSDAFAFVGFRRNV